MNRVKAVLVFAALGCLAVACMPSMGTAIEGDDTKSTKKQAATECGGGTLAPADPTKFEKCACKKGGKARCVPKKDLPQSLASQLDACDDGVCVPDTLVKSGGAAPKTCQSSFGEGRCMSMCIPEVAEKSTLLTRGKGDTCETDERCVPCLDPLHDNEPTGVCEIGKPQKACTDSSDGTKPATGGAAACPYTGPPVVDVSTFPSCGQEARCVPANLVPAAAASKLKACSGGLCAPEKSIAAGGNYLPPTCKSVGGGEGRCLNVNLPDVAAQISLLPQDSCDAAERCAPCFDPTSGAETGACRSVSCDAPKGAAQKFKDCCGGRAKCVPSTLVPAQSRESLDNDGCSSGELCAPNEQIDPNNQPVACQASGLNGAYNGFCVSDCVKRDFLQEIGTAQGTCGGGFFCAPCMAPSTTDIIFGFPPSEPTHVPGCNN